MQELYYWRYSITGVFLFGMLVHIILPLTGMMGHRLLPPHWHDHSMSGVAAHTHPGNPDAQTHSNNRVSAPAPCCPGSAKTGYSDGLAHSVNVESADFFAFPVLEDASHLLLNLPRVFQTRLAWVVPHTNPSVVRLFEPPPISL